MRHTAIDKLCTLVGGFSGADGILRATITGTHRPDKVGRRYRTPRHPVGDVAVIELPCDAPGRAPRSSIPYLWIFEGESKKKLGFDPDHPAIKKTCSSSVTGQNFIGWLRK